MPVSVILLLILLLFCGLYHLPRNRRSYGDLLIAGGKQSTGTTLLSLLSTMVGSSATLGIAATGVIIGAPVFWWLGAGSLGLLSQSIFVAAPLRELEVKTLGEAGKQLVGEKAETLIAAVIAVSWLGVIAGQFSALIQIFFHCPKRCCRNFCSSCGGYGYYIYIFRRSAFGNENRRFSVFLLSAAALPLPAFGCGTNTSRSNLP